jgi:hypothetical protein
MEMPRLGKSVRKVVVLQKNADGEFTPTVIYKSATKKRKVSSTLSPLEKGVRRAARAQVAFANAYFDKHNRSNEKQKDGWLTELIPNVANAGKKARKKLRITWLDPISSK